MSIDHAAQKRLAENGNEVAKANAAKSESSKARGPAPNVAKDNGVSYERQIWRLSLVICVFVKMKIAHTQDRINDRHIKIPEP